VDDYITNSLGIDRRTKFALAHVMPLCLSVAYSGSDVPRVSGKSGVPDLSVVIRPVTVRSLETVFGAMLSNVLNDGKGALVPTAVLVTHLSVY
jgi:hypothetical protein